MINLRVALKSVLSVPSVPSVFDKPQGRKPKRSTFNVNGVKVIVS